MPVKIVADAVNDIEKSLFQFSLNFGRIPGGEFHDGTDIKWAYSGGKYPNRVFGADFTGESTEEKILEVLAKYQSLNAPFMWIIGPSTRPRNIGEYLGRFNLKPGKGWTGMAVDLKDISMDMESLPGYEIIEVKGKDETSVFAKTAGEGFGFSENMGPDFQRAMINIKASEENKLRNFLGIQNGIPVSTCTLYEEGSIAGLYWVATIPSARKRGAASVIVKHALHEASRDGFGKSVLQASETGKPIYEKIGFREYCKFGIYLWFPH